MGEPITYRDAINHVKRGFHIIGLTGYTGSGCTTAKNILTSTTQPSLPGYDSLKGSDTGEVSLSKRGDRIYEKLERVWNSRTMWDPFIAIEVSPIIFGFAVIFSIENEKLTDYFPYLADRIRENKVELMNLNKLWTGIAISKDDSHVDEHKSILRAFDKIKSYYNEWIGQPSQSHEHIVKMQNYGDCIRRYGKAFCPEEDQVNPHNLFVIPEAIRRLINAYRAVNGKKYFVIDAFRNPFEIEFFKWRYAEFYLAGILCDKKCRIDRLKILPQDYDKINKREKNEEYLRKKNNLSEWVCSQDIDECLRKADIYIDNAEKSNLTPNLKFNLIKLLALSEDPGCIPPTQNERNMQIAAVARRMSGCISRQVGAVVTNTDGYVIGIGWNDPPREQTPCSLRTGYELVNSPTKEAFSEFERSSEFTEFVKEKYQTKNPFCFREALAELEAGDRENIDNKKLEFARALHAEENALLQAVRNSPESLKGGILYTTASPCNLCAKKAYHLGISKIIYIDEYPGIHIDQTIRTGVRGDKITVKGFEGVSGSAYFRLFSSSIPEKDLIQLFS